MILFSDQCKRKRLWIAVLLVAVLVVITVAVVAGVMVSTSRNTRNSGKLIINFNLPAEGSLGPNISFFAPPVKTNKHFSPSFFVIA